MAQATALDAASYSTEFGANLASTAVALCAVLALAWLVLRFIKRLQNGKADATTDDQLPRILRSVPLGGHERLVTVRFQGRDYLLGVTAGGISRIDATPYRAMAKAADAR